MDRQGESPATTLRLRADALTWRLLDDEIVALDLRRGTYLGVNPTGATIWPALVAGATHDELLSLIVDSFDVDRERARRDIDALVADLQARGLLEDAAPR